MFGSSNLKFKTMKNQTTIRKIQDEIENVTERKMRYTGYLKEELKIIATYCKEEPAGDYLWAAVKMIKAHADKMDTYLHNILESDCKLDSLEWVLDELNEEGGSNE